MSELFFEKLLNYYHITKEEYAELNKSVDISNFNGGRKFARIDKAVQLVNEVMNNHGKIVIYGDYDADGIMGTSILVKMFSYKDYIADYYVPNRYQDGYGLTLKKAQEFAENNYELVICVDNGISAFEPIDYLKNKGIKVLVLDHHQPQETLPNADVILHPQVSGFSEVASSGGFVAFMFSIAFLNRFDKYLSTLAAISTISDMMPLKETNRNLLRLVFANYVDGEFFAIDLLKESDAFDETSIGMRIAPKINAVGRLIDNPDINKMVEYFVTDNKDIVLNYINWINDNNNERKLLSAEAIDNVPEEIKESGEAIVYLTNCKEGIIGLIANNLCSKYHIPAIVFTKDASGEAFKGSCRAPEGYNVVEIFNASKDLLVAGGGHAGAGGCTIKASDFEAFKNRFVEIVKSTVIEHVEKETIQMNINEINIDNYNLVKTFAPFGEAWKAPIFKLSRIPSKNLFFSRTGEHILTQIALNTRITGFYFPKAEVSQMNFIDLYGTLRTSVYRNITSVEFLIKELKESAK